MSAFIQKYSFSTNYSNCSNGYSMKSGVLDIFRGLDIRFSEAFTDRSYARWAVRASL